jgi:hypothetical protein
VRYFDTGSDDFGDYGSQGNASIQYVNEAGVPEVVAQEAFRNTDVASAVENWMRGVSGGGGGAQQSAMSSLFFRNRYSLTTNIYDQMLQCIDAVEYDEILSTLADVSESLAFHRMSIEAPDSDQEDVWNQVAENLHLGGFMRQMWRELFKVSQCYVAIEWGERIFTVRTPVPDRLPRPSSNLSPEMVNQQNKMKALAGQTPDTMTAPFSEETDPQQFDDPTARPKQTRKRRKQYALYVPTGLSILDPTKVLPVGQLLFGRERFAYIASPAEDEAFRSIFDGTAVDPNVITMLEGPYNPSPAELAVIGARTRTDSPRLWLFKQDAVFRHSLSKAEYERFASIRLKSVLPLLDMKAHLRASDRATLIGATNFIVVLKRGTDKWPARMGEVEQLREQARVVARMPILVGDHRLSVEIVTPKMDNTLDRHRYEVLDERIIMRAMGAFRFGGRDAGASSSAEVDSQVVARGIEARRNEVALTIERLLFKQVCEKNPTAMTDEATITFHPRRITLATDANLINAVLKLRDRGDISRETELDELDFDQDVEFLRRRREKEKYDSAFKSSVPFSSPMSNPFAPGAAGSPMAPGGGNAGPSGPDGQSSTSNGRPPGATNNLFNNMGDN